MYRNDEARREDGNEGLDLPAGWNGRGDKAVGSGIPGDTFSLTGGIGRGHTGVTVVSSQLQSITRPVTRPQAARARRLEEVNETEGT